MSIHKSYQSSTAQHLSQQQVQKYQAGEMSFSEMQQAEKHLLVCEFCSDAVEGMAILSAEENAAAINELRSNLAAKTESRKVIPLWQWGVAASIVLLLSFISIFVLRNINAGNDNGLALENKDTSKIENAPVTDKPIADTNTNTEVLAQDNFIDTEVEIIEIEEESTWEVLETPDLKTLAGNRNQKNDVVEELEELDMLVFDIAEEEIIPAPAEEVEIVDFKPVPEIADRNLKKSSLTKAAPQKAKPAAVNAIMPDEAYNTSERIITGRVISETDEMPLPGVNVFVKSLNTSTVTDVDGRYKLSAPREEVVLVFAFVGTRTEEVKVGKEQQSADVILEDDLMALSEVVVTGVGGSFPINKNAAPEGGKKEFKEYLKDNTQYPQAAKENKVKGTVVLELAIDSEGEITGIKVLKSLGYGLDEEAIRLVKDGPFWNPAIKNGVPINKKVKLRIGFDAR